MSQFYPNDSDCIIEEQNISCIILDDTNDSEVNVESYKEIIHPVPQAIEENIEDGEVSEDDSNNFQKQTICKIKFPASQYKKYGSLVVEFLKENLCDKQAGKSIEIDETHNQHSVILIVQHVNQISIEDIPMPPLQKNDTFDKEASPDLSGLCELFTIDTTPAPKIDSVNIPSYKRAVRDALLDGEAAAQKKRKEEEEVLKPKKANACFNCGDIGHSIKDCSKPYNAQRIKNAKKSYLKVERYHVDIEQRFAHMKPGCISDKLREALCLRNGEIPFFFYRMRVLGYPPGWLEDAKVEQSGINLINSDGTKMLHSDEDEGEIDAINHKYNITKIHNFPGFNQDPGRNFYDDYKFHNVPPMDRGQMRDEFIKTLGDNVLKGYKRKKLKDFPNASTDDDIVETTIQEVTDMEIEDAETSTLGEVQFTRPPPPSEQPSSPALPPLPPSPRPSNELSQNVSEGTDREALAQSPSLIELEKQKQLLLQELQSNTSVIEIEDSLIDEIIQLEEDDDSSKQNINVDTNSNNSSISTMVAVNEAMRNEISTTVIKESYMGTPVLKFSPYDNLPNGDNFKIGVSDVINFENLPDSTGKYEQMKEVIKKVRSCINKLHNDE